MATDPRIDAYIARAAPFARPILARLRRSVHRGCPEAEETIKWGMPSFVYRGKILCGMAAFKAHATFGFWHRGMEKLMTKEIGRTNDAMGLLGRISKMADLPADKVLVQYIRTAKRLHDSGAPARVKSKPRPALPVPADLASALRKNRPAAAAWADFSPSARREYIEWITEAKRPDTRNRRLATTIEWVAYGKPRNWKYQNC
ncbi:MAG TPA: YdeI/OmpD-associated family protein [Lacunisphaera sp.]|nr:YdeI/OmpD-associated family protein [Lacunisphaera sp.]